jgi:hypothetical protein
VSADVELPCSDAAVRDKTGRDWSEWAAVLDADNAAVLSHRELARHVATLHDAGGWWSQTVAVGYERLRGKRAAGQQSSGTFAANASKTLPLPAAEAHGWGAEPALRERWLDEPVTIRPLGIPRIVSQVPCPQHSRNVGHTHWRTWMT